jgi:hypothetical protein
MARDEKLRRWYRSLADLGSRRSLAELGRAAEPRRDASDDDALPELPAFIISNPPKGVLQ